MSKKDGIINKEVGIFFYKWLLLHKIRMLYKMAAILTILAASINDGVPRKDGSL